MQLFYLDVIGPEFTLDGVSTDVSFQYPPVPKSLDKAILTFKYSMPGTGAQTLKVFAQCTDPSGSATDIKLGQGGSDFFTTNNAGASSADISQCLEIMTKVQEAVYACSNFRVVFEGTTAATEKIHVKDVVFRSYSVVGDSNVCGKCSKFCCQTLCTDLRFQLQGN